MWHLYIIECRNGAYYTGIIAKLPRRLREHSRGGSHYTSCHPIRKPLYVEKFGNRGDAEKREAQITRWTRAKKQALIRGDTEQLIRLSRSRD